MAERKKGTNPHWTRNNFTLKFRLLKSILNKITNWYKNKPFLVYSWLHSHCVMLAAWPSPRTPRQALLLEREAECNKNCKKAEEILFFSRSCSNLIKGRGLDTQYRKNEIEGKLICICWQAFSVDIMFLQPWQNICIIFPTNTLNVQDSRHVVLPLSMPNAQIPSIGK